MTTEQIDLAYVKQLIEAAKELKQQLNLTKEQRDEAIRERDVLVKEIQNKSAEHTRKDEAAKTQYANELRSVKEKLEGTIKDLEENSKKKLDETIKTYEEKLQTTTNDCESKVASVTEKLTNENDELKTSLQATQDKYQAVIDRIRGITS